MSRFTFLTQTVCFCLSFPVYACLVCVFICSCLTLAATNVNPSAWCPHATTLKIASFVASSVMLLVIISILLAGKRTLEFYADQLTTTKTKKTKKKF